MKPIVEGMGLSWQGQHEKMQANQKRFCVKEILIQAPGDDQRRNAVCMPLRKLPGWLMSIHPNKVKPEIKDSIIAYQNECDDVLWQHWSQGRNVPPTATIASQPRLMFAAQRIARSLSLERDAGCRQALVYQLKAAHDHLGIPMPPLHLFGKPSDQYQLEV